MPPEAPLSPEVALDYLGQMSTDIVAAVLLDEAGRLAAHSATDDETGDRLAELAGELFERAGRAAPEHMDGVGQVEVVTLDGAVFAARDREWTVAVVAGRLALPSLMFYDLRSVLSDLHERAA